MDINTKAEGLISEVHDLGKRIVELKAQCAQPNAFGPGAVPIWYGHSKAEVVANLTLAIRHMEDAQSRVERAWCLMGTETPIHQS